MDRQMNALSVSPLQWSHGIHTVGISRTNGAYTGGIQSGPHCHFRNGISTLAAAARATRPPSCRVHRSVLVGIRLGRPSPTSSGPLGRGTSHGKEIGNTRHGARFGQNGFIPLLNANPGKPYLLDGPTSLECVVQDGSVEVLDRCSRG